MGWFDGIGDFITNNSSWLKPVTNLVGNIGGSMQQSSNQSAYLDSLRAAEQRNYDDAKAMYEWQNQNAAANAASSAARSASAAAAANANEAQRVKAAKKGQKLEKKAFEEIKGIYKPYVETGARTLPIMEGLYGQGAGNASLLNAFMTDPKRMNNSKPAYEIDVPVPSWLKKKES